MFDAVLLPRQLPRRVSCRGFAASLLFCSLILNAASNPGFMNDADWLCPSRTETPESNCEEASQVVLTVPNSPRRSARQEFPRVSAPIPAHFAPPNCASSDDEPRLAEFLLLDSF